MDQPLFAPVPDGVQARLAALGTRWEYLHPALYAGEAERRTATPNHPANTAGTRAYQEHVRVLREMHIRHEGWKRLLHDRLELVCNPAKTIAIGVMPGDEATGQPGYGPRNLHARGAATERAAENNALQLGLFDPPSKRDETHLEPGEFERLSKWFLLSYRVQVGETVRIHSELSLPLKVEKGYVVKWQDRIPLPVLEMDGVRKPDDDEGPGEIDIPIDFR
ncbi:hypothetical protein [Streptomyces millisiae]|uniref:Uncharacterized protein n=1 Tax=Streptomyces millisiae TaxID=3075542 RepID=A0ABU2LP88_9ACTN|nr:hypothetical protein [Streptomyces sp. DSM 44918]MDT0319310.1 hypothetical protein [Streptomyces sp. DSM 44918]